MIEAAPTAKAMTVMNNSIDLESACLSDMAKNGFPLDYLHVDGEIHRFSIDGNKKKKDEWYVAYSWSFEGRPYLKCSYGSWSGPEIHYQYESWENHPEKLSFELQERLDQHWRSLEGKIAQERQKRQNEASVKAQEIWNNSFGEPQNAAQSSYLTLKKVQQYHTRFGRTPTGFDALIVPIQNIQGVIRSLQFISAGYKGTVYKHFLEDGEKKGCFSVIGNLETNPNKIFVSEGFSTAASVYESTYIPTVIAFDCGSLNAVIKELKTKYPKAQIVIAADDDVETKNNPGRTKAEAAAKKYNCQVVFPKFPDDLLLPPDKNGTRKRPTDWNDLLVHCGIDEVKRQLLSIENSTSKETPTHTTNFTLEELEKAVIDNECGDAALFKKGWGRDYVYDSDEKCFYVWNGTFWEIDKWMTRHQKLEMIADQYNHAADQVYVISQKDEKGKKRQFRELRERAECLKTMRRMKAVMEMAVSGPTSNGGLTLDRNWDDCIGYLPCANGLVDLKTGNLLESSREHFIRKNSPLKYDHLATCPLFLRFILEIMGEKRNLAEFLKRLFGYISIGLPIEHIYVFLYGPIGRNGKGTLIRLISKALGHLARNFQSELLLQQRNPPSSGAARPDLINLEGTRFALFSEINKGRVLDSALLKNLSGGDKVVGRPLFRPEKEFDPTHTLVFQANHKPNAPADDPALWRRSILIPFDITFVDNPTGLNEKKIDVHLEEKLEVELPGILRWIVEGAIEYHKHGLLVPEEVRSAVNQYRSENDGIGTFLKEKCVRDPIFRTRRGAFTKAIQAYCTEEGFTCPRNREINLYLRTEGFQELHTNNGDFWVGVSMLQPEEPLQNEDQ